MACDEKYSIEEPRIMSHRSYVQELSECIDYLTTNWETFQLTVNFPYRLYCLIFSWKNILRETIHDNRTSISIGVWAGPTTNMTVCKLVLVKE